MNTPALRVSPAAFLKQQAEAAREMHRLYPFTKTVSSAAVLAAKRKKAKP